MKEQGRPLFSVIVPCCNVARYLNDAVDSLRAQSCDDWECILSVDTDFM